MSTPALRRAGTSSRDTSCLMTLMLPSTHSPSISSLPKLTVLESLIGSTGSSTCPVKAMHKFLVSRRLYSHGPLFTFSSGDFLTRSAISTTTKSLLSAAGIDPGAYSSHSYRIGAATAAAEAGLPDHLIKTLGRWRSTAYQGDIRTSPEVLLKAAKQITQAQ